MFIMQHSYHNSMMISGIFLCAFNKKYKIVEELFDAAKKIL